MSCVAAAANSIAHSTLEPIRKAISGSPAKIASIVATVDDAANQIEPFVEYEQVDRDADAAQRRPREIERDVEQEQRQLEDAPASVADGSRQRNDEADEATRQRPSAA